MCSSRYLLEESKSKNKTPAHHHHHSVFPIWNPLWRSIQDTHVSSLHMGTTKRETLQPSQSVEKTETRCNTHTGRVLLIAAESRCVCMCVRMTAENLPRHKGKTQWTVSFQALENMWQHVTEGRLMLSLHFPCYYVLVWYLKCVKVREQAECVKPHSWNVCRVSWSQDRTHTACCDKLRSQYMDCK